MCLPLSAMEMQINLMEKKIGNVKLITQPITTFRIFDVNINKKIYIEKMCIGWEGESN